jgi:homocysteine S-methyltransferase
LEDFYQEKLKIFEKMDEIDIIAFETVPTKIDCRVISKIMKNSNKKAWVSLCCKNEEEVSSGEKVIDCVEIMNDCKNIISIGVNCTSPKYVVGLMNLIKKNSEKYLVNEKNKKDLLSKFRRVL